MKSTIKCLGAASLALMSAAAAPPPGSSSVDWAYPTGVAPAPPAGWSTTKRLTLPGAAASFTEAQTRDRFHAVDWRPRSHPAMPKVVASGRPPGVLACGFCHLPGGEGRPENASLAGLPRDYIINQVRQFATGARTSVVHGWGPSSLMSDLSRHATPSETAAAADYFSGLKFTSRVKVVETARIAGPAATNYLLVAAVGKPSNALGARIVEGPSSIERWERRDSLVSYTAFVPIGSLKRGAALSRGAAGTQVCATCHGEGLRGGGVGPPLAGRSPSYLFRQLYAFKTGARAGPDTVPMQSVVVALTPSDMIALAAFAGSRRP